MKIYVLSYVYSEPYEDYSDTLVAGVFDSEEAARLAGEYNFANTIHFINEYNLNEFYDNFLCKLRSLHKENIVKFKNEIIEINSEFEK